MAGTITSIWVNLTKQICGCIYLHCSTHSFSTGVTVWLGLSISVVKGLDLTFMNESGPVLLVPQFEEFLILIYEYDRYSTIVKG